MQERGLGYASSGNAGRRPCVLASRGSGAFLLAHADNHTTTGDQAGGEAAAAEIADALASVYGINAQSATVSA